MQLVWAYQMQLQKTGDEDLCYYNFRCAHPLYLFSDVNRKHIFLHYKYYYENITMARILREFFISTCFVDIISNVGYVGLGLLFCVVVFIRDVASGRERVVRESTRTARSCGPIPPPIARLTATRSPPTALAPHHLENERGIPPQFGLFYTMGIALIVEGLMSACYHVCPNRYNFQFDTAFMYLIAGLGVLRLYQSRHPDLHPKAHVAFLVYAAIVAIAVAGVLVNNKAVWLVFCVMLISFSVIVSLQIYFLGKQYIVCLFSIVLLTKRHCTRTHTGQWTLQYTTLRRLAVQVRGERIRLCIPARPLSFVLAVGFVAFNSVLGIYGVVRRPHDFATYVLAVLLVWFCMYLLYYIVMKLANGERISKATLTFAALTAVAWAISLWLFLAGLTNWQMSPAESRDGNRACFLLDFYDQHDAWHMMSALSVFFSFLVFLTIGECFA